MKVCFITKYPPIQGGVSTHCYWAARGLAERGHQVFVVTNADEVEDTFRISLSDSARVNGGEYAPCFHDSGGRVVVSSTQPPNRRELYYIPMGNPTVTRLATIATDIIREHDCKVIFSYYLEPYGVAAHLASQWTGVPYVFKHAGSDLNRLMQLPELHTAYVEVFRGANRIISRGSGRKLLIEEGIDRESISSTVVFALPPTIFNDNAPARPWKSWLAEKNENLLEEELIADDLPVLGTYGKLGEFKGSWDLLFAMARLRKENFPFHLIAASNGWQEPYFRRLVSHLSLTGFVHLIPFMPHWEIPLFIRSCTAVAFLERDFPIVAHSPTIPVEVLSCGGCLVLSAEVCRKQLFRAKIRDRQNVIVIPDPRRHDELAAGLRYALEDRQRASTIGIRGRNELTYDATYEDYVAELENLLISVAGESPQVYRTNRADRQSSPRSRIDVVDAVSRFFPCTATLLDADTVQRVRETAGSRAIGCDVQDPKELGRTTGDLLLSVVQNGHSCLVRDMCLYEYKMQEWGRARERKGKPTRWPSNDPEAMPRLVGDLEMVEFDNDLEPVLEAFARGESADPGAGPIKVLFHEGSAPLRVNEPTAWLISLLQAEEISLAQLSARASERYSSSGNCADGITHDCMAVLEGLYWEGIIDFESVVCESMNGQSELMANDARRASTPGR